MENLEQLKKEFNEVFAKLEQVKNIESKLQKLERLEKIMSFYNSEIEEVEYSLSFTTSLNSNLDYVEELNELIRIKNKTGFDTDVIEEVLDFYNDSDCIDVDDLEEKLEQLKQIKNILN